MTPMPRALEPSGSVRAYFGWRLRHWRSARGLTQAEFGAQIASSADEVSRVELAERWPPPGLAERCDDTLGTGGELAALWPLVDAERRSEHHADAGRIHPLLAGVGRGSGAIVVMWQHGEVYVMPTRREFLELLGAGTVAGAIEPAMRTFAQQHPGALEALEASRRAGASSLGQGVIDQLAETVNGLSHRFFHTSPGVLASEAFAARLYVGALLDGKLTVSEHRDLVALAGWLAALLACLVSDLGDRRAAAAWSADALARGREAGHAELTAWAHEIRALLAFYSGRPRDAVDAAREGQTVAPNGSPVQVQLLGQELRAWARLGELDEAEATLRRAETAADALPLAATSDGLFGINAVSVPYYATTTFLALGQPQCAESHAQEVLALLPPGLHPTMAALAGVDLGLARAGLGQPDGACEAGFLALGTQRLASSVLTRADELDTALQRSYPATAAARDFHECYLEVRRVHDHVPKAITTRGSWS